MTQRDWRCDRCKVVTRAAAQPVCPLCREPMPEEPTSAARTARIARCCLKGRRGL